MGCSPSCGASSTSLPDAGSQSETSCAGVSPGAASPLDGLWTDGCIFGTSLEYNGDLYSLTRTSPSAVSVRMFGRDYAATLESDGALHWSDGEVWHRQPTEDGDWGKGLAGQEWREKLEARARKTLLEELLRDGRPPEGSLAAVLVPLLERGAEGRALWEPLLRAMEYDPGLERPTWLRLRVIQSGDRVQPLEPGDLDLHSKTRSGGTPQQVEHWHLAHGEVATVRLDFQDNGEFYLVNPKGEMTFAIAPSMAAKFTLATGERKPLGARPYRNEWQRKYADRMRVCIGVCDTSAMAPAPAEEVAKVIRAPSGGDPALPLSAALPDFYNNLRPLEYVAHLLRDPQALLGVRTIRPMDYEDLRSLFGQLQRGEMQLYESPAIGSQGHSSAATNGFPLPPKSGSGHAVVSITGFDQSLYNRCMCVCMEDGFAWPITWEKHYGNAWYTNWLRGTLAARVEGAEAIVLSGAPNASGQSSRGSLGFAQRAEAASLLALGVSFKTTTAAGFYRGMRPLVSLANSRRWQDLKERCATCSPELLRQLVKTDGNNGSVALTWACAGSAPAALLHQMMAVGSDPVRLNWRGEMALHLCAHQGHLQGIEAFLEKDVVRRCVNVQTAQEESALYLAMLYRNHHLVTTLRKAGAVLDAAEREWLAECNLLVKD